jgi:hypothetical protein
MGIMRTLAFWATATVVVGLALPAQGESIYRYHDPDTSRDVFVTHLDQVPVQLREQAKLVVSDGVLVDSTSRQEQNAPQGTVIYAGKNASAVAETIKQALADARRSGTDAGALYRTLSTAIDTALVKMGKRPLSAAHGAEVKRLLAKTAVELTVASGLAFVALILVMAHAFRAGHRWWFVFMLFFQLLGIAYVLIHVEANRRWFKFATLFAQAAPFAVAAATAWRFASLFRTIATGS